MTVWCHGPHHSLHRLRHGYCNSCRLCRYKLLDDRAVKLPLGVLVGIQCLIHSCDDDFVNICRINTIRDIWLLHSFILWSILPRSPDSRPAFLQVFCCWRRRESEHSFSTFPGLWCHQEKTVRTHPQQKTHNSSQTNKKQFTPLIPNCNLGSGFVKHTASPCEAQSIYTPYTRWTNTLWARNALWYCKSTWSTLNTCLVNPSQAKSKTKTNQHRHQHKHYE